MQDKTLRYKITRADGDSNVLDVSIFYDKGGSNYFSGGVNRRGYYVSATPKKVEGNFVKMTMFEGLKMFLLEVNRFSQKKLDELSFDTEEVKHLVSKVCAKYDITIIDNNPIVR